MMRDTLNLLMSACNIFDEISPNEFRLLLYLRLAELPVHIDKMDVKISEKKLRDIVTDYKKKGLVSQRVVMGPISLTQKGNALLDSLLVKIQQ